MNNVNLVLHLKNNKVLETTMTSFEFESFKYIYLDKSIDSIVFEGTDRTIEIPKTDMISYETEEIIL